MTLPGFLAACEGRCRGAHFGTYDYTASCNVTAAFQVMDHPWCDLAKGNMLLAYAGTGIFLSDGSTNVLPVAPHAGTSLTSEQVAANRTAVHQAWRLSHGHIRHSLEGGFYQGWDLHPAQIPVRFATCYAFFLEGFALTMVSGVLGFAVAIALCAAVNTLPMPTRFQGMTITWQAGLAAVVALTAVGVVTATYPARRAAELPPVEALRFEA